MPTRSLPQSRDISRGGPNGLLGWLLGITVALMQGCAGESLSADAQRVRSEAWTAIGQARWHQEHGDLVTAGDMYLALWRQTAAPEPEPGVLTVDLLGYQLECAFRDEPILIARFQPAWHEIDQLVWEGAATGTQIDAWLELMQLVGDDQPLVAYMERFGRDEDRMSIVRDSRDRSRWVIRRLGREGRQDLAQGAKRSGVDAVDDMLSDGAEGVACAAVFPIMIVTFPIWGPAIAAR